MRLPSFNELDEKQLVVYEQAPDSSILVVGPPGSGKTSMAIWRARLLVSPEYQRNVVLVTRNRLLAAVAGQLAQENNGAQINATTMNKLISNDYSQRFRACIPELTQYNYNWDEVMRNYGATGAEPAYDHMIIDEGQNLPPEFIRWAVKYGARAVSVFADEDQTTIGAGSKIAELQAAGFVKVLPLLVNHRNTEEIADVIEHFHVQRIVPRGMPSRGRSGEFPRLMAIAKWAELADTVAFRLSNRREAIGVIVFFKEDVTTVADLLRERLGATRVDSYISGVPQGAEADILMRENGVTVITGESAIGLEFDTLYLQDLSRSLPVSEAIDNRRLYMLCARAKHILILVNGPDALSAAQLASLPPPTILER